MTLKLAHVAVDCADTLAVARFWSEALGLPIKPEASAFFAALDGGPDGPDWFFLKVPEGKAVKNRVHVDLQADDPEAEIARLVGLGATRSADKNEWGFRWTVMADIEGNEFCVAGSHD
jgi:catechol 2,3-dioxygenase-like lactoylglutathione lyase family enzyme